MSGMADGGRSGSALPRPCPRESGSALHTDAAGARMGTWRVDRACMVGGTLTAAAMDGNAAWCGWERPAAVGEVGGGGLRLLCAVTAIKLRLLLCLCHPAERLALWRRRDLRGCRRCITGHRWFPGPGASGAGFSGGLGCCRSIRFGTDPSSGGGFLRGSSLRGCRFAPSGCPLRWFERLLGRFLWFVSIFITAKICEICSHGSRRTLPC